MFDPPLASVELVEKAVARVDVRLLVRLGIGERDRPRANAACGVAVDSDRARVELCDWPGDEEVIEIVADFRMRRSRLVADSRQKHGVRRKESCDFAGIVRLPTVIEPFELRLDRAPTRGRAPNGSRGCARRE